MLSSVIVIVIKTVEGKIEEKVVSDYFNVNEKIYDSKQFYNYGWMYILRLYISLV